MVDLTRGKVFDRVSYTWFDRDQYDRIKADREERWFQSRPHQGQLCTPMILSDGMDAVKSMTNGQMYDSKSELRKEYRSANVIEVGTEGKALRGLREKREKEQEVERKKGVRDAVETALSQAGFGAV